MERRKYITSIVGVGATGLLAGCVGYGTPTNTFKLVGLGLIKREDTVASYADVKNVTDSASHFEANLAVFNDEGIRVSPWQFVSDEHVRANETRRVYVPYELEDSGWGDGNNLGQVVDSHHTKLSAKSDTEVTGEPMGEENIGEMIDRD